MLTGDGLERFKPLVHRVEKMAKCLTIFQHYTFYLQVNLLSHLLLIKITDQNILTSFLVSTAEAAVKGVQNRDVMKNFTNSLTQRILVCVFSQKCLSDCSLKNRATRQRGSM